MPNCVLLIGPICSGKTTLAKKLHEKGFIKRISNSYSIESCRRGFGNGLMSGEMFAWGNFLQQIEEPPTNDNAIYEFSGTGKNHYNVAEAMRYARETVSAKWVVVYCLASKNILLERYATKTYDAPCPYRMNDPENSIDFMNKELKETFDSDWHWAQSPKIKIDMNVENYDEIADQIINHFN